MDADVNNVKDNLQMEVTDGVSGEFSAKITN
jgi:hypothetical protein